MLSSASLAPGRSRSSILRYPEKRFSKFLRNLDRALKPIQAETLELLEWHRLCQQLATFASTKRGAIACRELQIPQARSETEILSALAREARLLESQSPQGLNFSGIEDIEESLQRAQLGGLLWGRELYPVATTLAGVRQLCRTIAEAEAVPHLQRAIEGIATYPDLEREIRRCIEEDGSVSDRASSELANLRQRQRQVRDRVYQMLNTLKSRHASALQEGIITQRGDRFVLPVKATHRDVLPGIVHDVSASGATFYIEPRATVELNNDLRQLVRQAEAEEERICWQLTGQVVEASGGLQQAIEVAERLDLAAAKARYGSWLGGYPATFVAEGSPNLRQLRHPLLVWQEKHEQGQTVVPADVALDPQVKVVAITGPNTGGKTATLKSLGLAVLMAKAGMFVAALDPVVLPWFDRVLADIGDEQSLEQSLSTFSGHIRRIGRILDELTPHSLVLLDEVGAGTDPVEATALAAALLEYLADRGGLTLTTTHFGELKALKYQDDRFENAAVTFDEETLSPTYRVLWGVPGRSMALAIARRLGLLPAIVDRASELVGTESDTALINKILQDLEAQRRTQEEKAARAQHLVAQAETLHRELSERARKLEEHREKLRQQQEEEVAGAIAAAKAEIAKTIRQLQQGSATAQQAQKVTEEIDRLAESHLPPSPEKKRPKSYRPQTGERVRVVNLGQVGEIVRLDPEAEQVTVRLGVMKMTVGFGDIESLKGEKVESKRVESKHQEPKVRDSKSQESKQAPAPRSPRVRTQKNTLDIRGLRVEEGQVEVERVIASADSDILWILHGKGTGKLRQGIHEVLKVSPSVDRFELAEPGDGGAGVTIVYLQI